MLGQLRPERAILLQNEPQSPVDLKSQRSEDVEVGMLEIGDHILIRPGSIPPADGTIIEGTTTVDESSLTGESIPILKGPGESILTGTTILTTAVIMRIDHLGDETMIQQIVRAVGESQNQKAPIEELADQITAVFVPIVIYLAIIVSVVWLSLSLTPGAIPDSYLPSGHTKMADRIFFALEFAIAVLAVACPCGIGLAAPAAQAVGEGMTAQAGILAQGGGTAFQLATKVDTVVFDKTGTLTQGNPSVIEADLFRQEVWLLEAVRAIEQTSSHPLAAALVSYSESQALCNEKGEGVSVEVLEMEEIPGKGTQGRIKVQHQGPACNSNNEEKHFSFRLGNAALIADSTHPEQHGQRALAVESWQKQGYSIVYFALSDSDCTSSQECVTSFSTAAIFAIFDPPRAEAKRVIASLKRSGKTVYMLSGDNEVTARTIGRELGIDTNRIVAGVLPLEKAQFIQQLREQETRAPGVWPWNRSTKRKAVVMFAGDGLNDSAAVAGADVG
jgi:Cu+-exporting ATPase